MNECDFGVAATCLPPACYAVVDLNGRCEEISVIPRILNFDSFKAEPPMAERQDSQKEKADTELQEKYPEQQLAEQTDRNYRIDIKRRHSKELTKTEQKLSSSDSYNSGIQQISSQAASCSFQTDTDNFNTQIQQLTIDLKSDLQRSSQDDPDPTIVTSSDSYNTEIQILSAHGNPQVNSDDLNLQIQQLTTSNSGVDISSTLAPNIPRSQSHPFLTKNAKELFANDEKIDEDKDKIGNSSSAVETLENEDEEQGNDLVVVEKNDNQSYSKNSMKSSLKTKRQTAKFMSLSSQNLRNSQSSIRCHCDYFSQCLRFKNMLGLPGTNAFYSIYLC